MAQIVITTLGTLGDLHPMFPVADGLMKRGHRVQFVVPPLLHAMVVNEGFPSQAVQMLPDPPPEIWSAQGAAAKAYIDKYYTPFLRQAIAALTDACASADVLLSTPHQVATAVVGKRLGIPWVTLTVFPGLIPSSYTVPEPHWLPALPTPAGRLVNRLTWSVFRLGLGYLSGDAITAALDPQDLKGDRQLFRPGGLSPHLCLVMSSPVYSPRLPDWPPQIKLVGFAPWDVPRGWVEPAGLAAFLEAGPPPIVVVSSSGRERDGALYIALARQAIEKTGRRGILLTARATDAVIGNAPNAVYSSGVAAWPYLPLSRILPRASMVVHHAGIGTSTAAIRHGRPAVAIPASFDQWYNAGRVRELGVARVIRYQDLSVDRLTREIELVSSDPRYGSRARELAGKMASENAAGTACDEIESLLAKHSR